MAATFILVPLANEQCYIDIRCTDIVSFRPYKLNLKQTLIRTTPGNVILVDAPSRVIRGLLKDVGYKFADCDRNKTIEERDAEEIPCHIPTPE